MKLKIPGLINLGISFKIDIPPVSRIAILDTGDDNLIIIPEKNCENKSHFTILVIVLCITNISSN